MREILSPALEEEAQGSEQQIFFGTITERSTRAAGSPREQEKEIQDGSRASQAWTRTQLLLANVQSQENVKQKQQKNQRLRLTESRHAKLRCCACTKCYYSNIFSLCSRRDKAQVTKRLKINSSMKENIIENMKTSF